MHAYLIVDKNQERVRNKAKELSESGKSQFLNFSLEKIENVRELIKFSALSVSKKTTIFIDNIDKASTEALNAFLKLLEEPQENLEFILGSSSSLNIPQTIVSRCLVIHQEVSGYGYEHSDFADNFFSMSPSDRFGALSKIRTKDEASDFLKKLILGLHARLHEDKDFEKIKLVNLLKLTQKTLISINLNGNVTAQLTNLGVQI
ncbi:hypothetical protein A2962_04805 [Candidatus Woesebacteria bacterium RIFCSPLOWO2_01_FULL_39_61]|uniref:DNA polymerase III delta N-terminal domain-containing protein n=1 Tax=Candidatus Woesebacteria bacterium RIFCSPHIGHO2_02_FULL_39_13 TaxID=1802505 RepID=A0A1F7Z5B8_9BACT|nr:MAG: hypothetical protein A2692_01125 [Candidatus Woesebacteria bacterium RIFCSPHIGHO2_01_FULL_39_95]OGM34319.1 MAG: hypothetical protein A3D01_00930 [Candidatus Woesebacteria bacterium RIFCSPHIGHO2_02_FULL_39_13]OGM39101.1 MAG: hypothetical protein A3E13_01655 [Candidatus Woesebacteria bacterium RIFCSPHIGHO2_12_FULL_40_20]OGM68656.1 MAG: hypothetical protein A2962_04805 [Candidatus Woesebacteria bacterium RIFCSPLOWO2_01_FULL_39_61]OGM73512.1 MAG: hypothetical protein A3H19_00400 [Candidatus